MESDRSRSEEEYRRLVEGIDAIVWEWDPTQRRFTFISRAVESILGYSADEWLRDGTLWTRVIHPDDYPRVAELRRNHAWQGTVEYRAIARSGDIIRLSDRVRPADDAGRTTIRGVATVIAERESGLDPLRRALNVSPFDELPAMVWRSNAQGGNEYFNPAWLEFTGRSVDEERGAGWLKGVHPEDVDRVADHWAEAVSNGSRFSVEYRLRHCTGVYRPVLDLGRPFHDENGRRLGHIGCAFDLTEQRALEEQLRQAQKIEAVGQLAGGIAHDFNNILMAIQGHTEVALSELTLSDAAYEEVEEIRRAAERAARLTRQLLAFSRKQLLQPRVFEMGVVIGELSEMLRRLIPASIEVEFDGPAANARVNADRGQIEQVVLNLVVNARDAMPDGGRLRISVDIHQEGTDDGTLPSLVPAGAYVRVSVADTGSGMDARTLSHLFEPFFTTKEPGRGTGLGLATVYGIVKQSGGFIFAESEPGRGSTFRVLLPLVEKADDRAAAQERRSTGVQGAETILVVEDEPPVRRLITRALERKGYRVLEAGDAATALELLDERALPPHMLLSDIVLPGASGTELARQVTARYPHMAVMLISGFPRDRFVDGVPADWAFLEKPFSPADLVLRVRSQLDRRQDPDPSRS